SLRNDLDASLSSRRPQPATITLFPYTTLFRFINAECWLWRYDDPKWELDSTTYLTGIREWKEKSTVTDDGGDCFWTMEINYSKRSEEHTSELQSRENLVCRLLLEKKKQHTQMR